MADVITRIGSGETVTTIATWESTTVPANLVTATQRHIGQCKAEAFAVTVVIDGHTASADYYMWLMSEVGAEHDGRAHAVSAAGNARITGTGATAVRLLDNFARFSWMEISNWTDAGFTGVEVNFVTACTVQIDHNIIHNDDTSANANNFGIYAADDDCEARIFRNIVYGVGASGIYARLGAAGSGVHCNTVYNNNASGSNFRSGLWTSDAGDTDFAIMANVAMDNSDVDIDGTAGTLDWNYTEDATGDDEGANGVAGLTPSSTYLTAPTATWANTDLLPLAALHTVGAMDGTARTTAFGASYTTVFPGIDESIDNRGVSITGDWTVGAGQYVSAGPATGIEAFKYYYDQQEAVA